jgi:hypothetical protein
MKSLIAGGVILAALGTVAALILVRRRRHFEVAGSMSVGAVDEVELSGGLGRSLRADAEPAQFDPEEVPSEHAEINDLRRESLHGAGT